MYCLPAWSPNLISVRQIQTVLKSETTSLDDNGCFVWGNQWISKRKIASHATMFSKWMCAWKIPVSEELNPFIACHCPHRLWSVAGIFYSRLQNFQIFKKPGKSLHIVFQASFFPPTHDSLVTRLQRLSGNKINTPSLIDWYKKAER